MSFAAFRKPQYISMISTTDPRAEFLNSESLLKPPQINAISIGSCQNAIDKLQCNSYVFTFTIFIFYFYEPELVSSKETARRQNNPHIDLIFSLNAWILVSLELLLLLLICFIFSCTRYYMLLISLAYIRERERERLST